MQALVERIAPGGRLVRKSRLHGGIGSLVDRVRIERADGSRLTVAVRRSAPEGDHAHVTPEKAAYEFVVLETVRKAGVPAPAPVLLDVEGDLFGATAIVVECIPGRPRLGDENIATFVRAMARALLTVHAVTPEGHDVSGLKMRRREAIRDRMQSLRAVVAHDPFAQRVHGVADAALDQLELLPATLTHGDFWSGNVIWNRGRIAGIVDWSGAAVGDRRQDVSELRIDLVIGYGIDAADVFTQAYEEAWGHR